jgi:hypothetical protein
MAMVDEKWGNQQVAAYDSSYNKANYWGKKSIKISFGPGMSNAPGTGARHAILALIPLRATSPCASPT